MQGASGRGFWEEESLEQSCFKNVSKFSLLFIRSAEILSRKEGAVRPGQAVCRARGRRIPTRGAGLHWGSHVVLPPTPGRRHLELGGGGEEGAQGWPDSAHLAQEREEPACARGRGRGN